MGTEVPRGPVLEAVRPDHIGQLESGAFGCLTESHRKQCPITAQLGISAIAKQRAQQQLVGVFGECSRAQPPRYGPPECRPRLVRLGSFCEPSYPRV